MNHTNRAGESIARFAQHTGLRIAGFAWMFLASFLLLVGAAVGLLGLAGGILVRARPDTGNVINYDPSRVASFAPVPFAIGFVMTICFVVRARRIQH